MDQFFLGWQVMAGEKWLVKGESRGVFKTQSNFYKETFLQKNSRLKAAIFVKSSVIDVRLGSKYTSGKTTIFIIHDWKICRDIIKHLYIVYPEMIIAYTY